MFALLYAAAFGGFGPGVGSAFAFGLVTSAMICAAYERGEIHSLLPLLLPQRDLK
jgi:hypothetical protein